MGLFGPTPQEVAQAQNAQGMGMAMQQANVDPLMIPAMWAGRAGQQFGNAINGMLGYQDPMMDKARRARQAQQMTDQMGIDINTDPVNYYRAAQKNLIDVGLHDMAAEIEPLAMKAQQQVLEAEQVDTARGKKAEEARQAKDYQSVLAEAYDSYNQGSATEARKLTNGPSGEGQLDANGNLIADSVGIMGGGTPDQDPNFYRNYLIPMLREKRLFGQMKEAMTSLAALEKDQNATRTPLTKLQQERDALKKQRESYGKIKNPSEVALGKMKDLDDQIAEINAAIQKQNAESSGGAGTAAERAYAILGEYENKAKRGEVITPEDEAKIAAAKGILGRKTMSIDPNTGKMYAEQAFSMDAYPNVMGGRYLRPSAGVAPPQSGAPGMPSVGSQGPAMPRPQGQAPRIPVNQLPSLEGGRKPIDQGTETKLNAMGAQYSGLQRMLDTFNPDYVGFMLDTAGEGAFQAGRRGVSQWKDMAEWHQAYEDFVADVRKDRFGQTLTGNELANFEKYKIKFSDTPQIAKDNLQRQFNILQGAMERQLNAIDKSGQNGAQARALLGIPETKPSNPQDVQGSREVPPPVITVPKNARNNNGVMEWEDNQYMYRKLPDGRVQRKAR